MNATEIRHGYLFCGRVQRLQPANDLRDVGAVCSPVADHAHGPVQATLPYADPDLAAAVHIRDLAAKVGDGLNPFHQQDLQLPGGPNSFSWQLGSQTSLLSALKEGGISSVGQVHPMPHDVFSTIQKLRFCPLKVVVLCGLETFKSLRDVRDSSCKRLTRYYARRTLCIQQLQRDPSATLENFFYSEGLDTYSILIVIVTPLDKIPQPTVEQKGMPICTMHSLPFAPLRVASRQPDGHKDGKHGEDCLGPRSPLSFLHARPPRLGPNPPTVREQKAKIRIRGLHRTSPRLQMMVSRGVRHA